jgi:hypothetical protein
MKTQQVPRPSLVSRFACTCVRCGFLALLAAVGCSSSTPGNEPTAASGAGTAGSVSQSTGGSLGNAGSTSAGSGGSAAGGFVSAGGGSAGTSTAGGAQSGNGGSAGAGMSGSNAGGASAGAGGSAASAGAGGSAAGAGAGAASATSEKQSWIWVRENYSSAMQSVAANAKSGTLSAQLQLLFGRRTTRQ